MKKVAIDIEDKIDQQSEKIRRKSELSSKAIRQLATLKHYFKIDEKNRIVTIPLHYKKVSEIFDINLDSKEHPFVKREFLVTISSILHSIPIEFLIDVDVKIDDYEGYNPTIILDSIKDAFELFHYDVIKEKTRSNLKVAILIFLGVTILAWLFYLCSKKLIGPTGDPTHDTVHELVYTVGAVVLWEAVYIIFLPDDEYKDVSYYLLWRMNSLRLLDKKSNILKETNVINMNNSWMIETKKEKRARYFLLLSGTTLVCLSVIKIRDIVENIILHQNEWSIYLITPLAVLIVIFGFIAGLGAISYYRDKGPFKKFVLFFGIVASIFYIIETIAIIVIFILDKTYDIKMILSAVVYAIVMIAYTSCAFMLRKKKERK